MAIRVYRLQSIQTRPPTNPVLEAVADVEPMFASWNQMSYGSDELMGCELRPSRCQLFRNGVEYRPFEEANVENANTSADENRLSQLRFYASGLQTSSKEKQYGS